MKMNSIVATVVLKVASPNNDNVFMDAGLQIGLHRVISVLAVPMTLVVRICEFLLGHRFIAVVVENLVTLVKFRTYNTSSSWLWCNVSCMRVLAFVKELVTSVISTAM